MKQIARGNVPERVRKLLKDTITVMCKSSLQYDTEVSVEGLIGITLDKKDIFLVNLNELIKNEVEREEELQSKHEADSSHVYGDEGTSVLSSEDELQVIGKEIPPAKKKRRRRRSQDNQSSMPGAPGFQQSSAVRMAPSHSLGADPNSPSTINIQPMASPALNLEGGRVRVKADPDPVPVSLIPSVQFSSSVASTSSLEEQAHDIHVHSQSLPLFTSTPSQSHNQPAVARSTETICGRTLQSDQFSVFTRTKARLPRPAQAKLRMKLLRLEQRIATNVSLSCTSCLNSIAAYRRAEEESKGRPLANDERARLGLKAVQGCGECYPQFIDEVEVAWVKACEKDQQQQQQLEYLTHQM